MTLTIKDNNSKPTSVLYDVADKKTMEVSLPEDLILFQIITRVPAKSVIRLKCVSKQWNSFLMSDRFKQMHSRNFLKDPQLEDQTLIFVSKGMFFTMDCESLPIKPPCPRPFPQFEVSSPGYTSILTSYHGLVCLSYYTDDYKDSYIILWNPLTTEYKWLSEPANPDHMECYKHYGRGYGLYYSSCEDDYKLLVVTYSYNLYIYSLKSDSWRKLNKKAPFPESVYFDIPGFCWKENIYFLLPDTTSIRFNTTAERFHKIETLPGYENINKHYSTASTVHKGSVHVCVKLLKSNCIELWKFNADGDMWSKVETYHVMPNSDIQRKLALLHLMSNGNLLMRDYNDGGRICQVDLEKKKYTGDKDGHKSKGNCHDEYKLHYSDVKVGIPQQFRYTETFVSPNQCMK